MLLDNVKKSSSSKMNFKHKYIVDLIIVTYYPNEQLLVKLIKKTEHQVRNIIIVDNTDSGCFSEILSNYKMKDNIHVVFLGKNVGIAQAQNIGIKIALKNKADFVFLSDQDTLFPTNYVNKMVETYETLSREYRIGAIGPAFWDETRNKIGEFIIPGLISLKAIEPTEGIYFVDYLISSGMIIPSPVLKDVGLMNEKLFIDWVDIEWCWRVPKKGYKLIGNANVKVNHGLGYKTKKFLGKQRTLRSAIRHYYMIRNATYLLLHKKKITFKQRLYLLSKIFKWVIGYPLLAEPRLKHFKLCTVGLYHGLKGQLGKYEKK